MIDVIACLFAEVCWLLRNNRTFVPALSCGFRTSLVSTAPQTGGLGTV